MANLRFLAPLSRSASYLMTTRPLTLPFAGHCQVQRRLDDGQCRDTLLDGKIGQLDPLSVNLMLFQFQFLLYVTLRHRFSIGSASYTVDAEASTLALAAAICLPV